MGKNQYRCNWTDTTTDALPFDLDQKVWVLPTWISGVHASTYLSTAQEQRLDPPNLLTPQSEIRATKAKMKKKKKRTTSPIVFPLPVSESMTRPFSLNFRKHSRLEARARGKRREWNPNSSSSVCSYPNARNLSTSPHIARSSGSIAVLFSGLYDITSGGDPVKTILRIFREMIEEITSHCGFAGESVKITSWRSSEQFERSGTPSGELI